VAYTVPKLTDYSERELGEAVAQFRLVLETERREIHRRVDDPALTPAVRQDLLKRFRDRWVGRKSGLFGHLNDLWLKNAPPDRKKHVGQLINQVGQTTFLRLSNSSRHWISLRGSRQMRSALIKSLTT